LLVISPESYYDARIHEYQKNTGPLNNLSLTIHLSLSVGRHLLGIQFVTNLTSNLYTYVTTRNTSQVTVLLRTHKTQLKLDPMYFKCDTSSITGNKVQLSHSIPPPSPPTRATTANVMAVLITRQQYLCRVRIIGYSAPHVLMQRHKSIFTAITNTVQSNGGTIYWKFTG
jgi:hypothetical protein